MDSHETKIYTALLIAGAILGIFLMYFVITVIRHQRRNQALYKEKINAEITTLEKERTRIASDLHDDLGPMLSAVKLLMNNIDLHNDGDKESVRKANKYMDGILLQLRTISNDLVPMALGRKGLVVALEEYISEQNDQRDMKVSFKTEPELFVRPEGSIHLYRIIHEVIHNANKHARATDMEIQLHYQNELLILRLKDNGCGFDTRDSVTTQRGLGLRNILSRVEALKGNIYIQSGPKTGTEYTIEIPV